MAKKRAKKRTAKPVADPAPGTDSEELETIERTGRVPVVVHGDNGCRYCARPIITAPYYRSGNRLYCCQTCRNGDRHRRGLPLLDVVGDGDRPRTGSGVPLDRALAIWIPVRCPSCQSEQREKFTGNARRVETSGRSPITGERYNVVVFRWTSCRDCGQSISAKSYEWDAELDDDNQRSN